MKIILVLVLVSVCFLYKSADSRAVSANLQPSAIQWQDARHISRQRRQTDSLLEAVKGIQIEDCDVDEYAVIATDYFKREGHISALTIDENAAIKLYTDDCLYRALNAYLRKNDDAGKFKPYVDLLLKALSKLPSTYINRGTVWRGTDVNLDDYKVNREIIWKAFTSTSAAQSVAIEFVVNSGGNVLFKIQNSEGYDIDIFSEFSEDEILLPPKMKFKVVSIEDVEGQNYKLCVLHNLISASGGYAVRVTLLGPQTLLAAIVLTLFVNWWHY